MLRLKSNVNKVRMREKYHVTGVIQQKYVRQVLSHQ